MNGYYTYISRKQIGVIFANWKRGNVNLTQDHISFLYDECAEVKGFNNNMNFEDVLQKVKRAVDAIFSGDYDQAEKAVVDAYDRYHACFKTTEELMEEALAEEETEEEVEEAEETKEEEMNEIEIMMATGISRKEAERHSANGSIVFTAEDYIEECKNWMDDEPEHWQRVINDVESAAKDTHLNYNDGDIVFFKGVKHYIMWVL